MEQKSKKKRRTIYVDVKFADQDLRIEFKSGQLRDREHASKVLHWLADRIVARKWTAEPS